MNPSNYSIHAIFHKKFLPFSLGCAAALAFTASAQAQTVYFDVNGATPGFGDGSTGTPYNWTADPVWSTSAAGTAATTDYGTASGNASANANFDLSGNTGGNITLDLQNNLTVTSVNAGGTGANLILTTTNGSTLTSSAFVANTAIQVDNMTVAGDFAESGGNYLIASGSTYWTGTASISGRVYLYNSGSSTDNVNMTGGNIQQNYGMALGNISGTSGSITVSFGNGIGGGGGLTVTSTQDTTYGATIDLATAFGSGSTGTGQFTKLGNATLTLTGNSYANFNHSTIGAGTLVADNGNVFSATSTGVEVQNGATLRINSGIKLNAASDVTLDGATAVLDVGTAGSTGKAELLGDLTALNGATLKFDLDGAGQIVDLLTVDGALALNGSVTFDFANLGVNHNFLPGTEYQIIAAANGDYTNFSAIVNGPSGWSGGVITHDANGVYVEFAATPEPSTWALMAVGLALCGVMHRRMRASKVA